MSTDYRYTLDKYQLLEQLDTVFFQIRVLKEEDIELQDLPDDLCTELENLYSLLEIILHKSTTSAYSDKTVRISSLKEKLYKAIDIVNNLNHLTLQPNADLDVDDIAVLRQLRNYLNVI